MPRKHLVASQTSKKQQLQAKLWQKLAREIKAAVKIGGKNIEANPRLKAAVDKALQNNLSRDSIERNINGPSSNEDSQIVDFECYGPNGIQIIIHGLTNNINRITSNIRGYLSKLHGEIAKPNSVRLFFDNLGQIIVYKKSGDSIDNLLEITMQYNIVDIFEADDGYEILTNPQDFYKVKEELIKHQYQIFDADIKLIPQNKINSIDEDTKMRLDRFINACDEDDDIQ
jgi:YebC/PmpR family DNA-binding regulatory protein